MRKILFALIGCFVAICAHAAQVVNVDYVHKLIAQKWDISVPIKTNNIMAVANMKYLLTAVDVANEILNGEKTTDYGNTEFATTQVADTVATIQAVDTLVRKIDNITPAPEDAEYKFFLTTMPDTDSFNFKIIAAGEFYIDWGDGKTQLITKNDVEYTEYSYKYKKTGTYTIKLGGIATGYTMEGDSYVEPGISFYSSASKIASIDGSLGAIFGTLADGTVPNFSGMFSGAGNLSSIPANLFSGVNGTQEYMFENTFYGCSGLTSIPSDLFAGISGAPAESMFSYTFYGCSGLTSIPSDLFAGISGAPASYMFGGTFSGCESLTYIPADLFAGVSGIIPEGMFYGTFAGCTSLRTIPEELFARLDGGEDMYIGGLAFAETFAGSGIESIPENLFGNITLSLPFGAFMQTFAYCPNLTGPSARINGVYLYNIWPDATEEQVYGMYEGSTGLDDYACIPYAWGGGGEECGASAPEDAEYKFFLTTTSDTDVFAMKISAAGEFYIDWGDGKTKWITKPDTTDTTYSHNYDTAGAYTIGIGGQATAYNTDEYTAAISFSSSASKIASIDGSLGAIFGTLSSDTNNQPRFYQTFYNASNMTGSIPENLFAGISGAPAIYMFSSTFYGCSGLTSIPDGLFAGISGAPASYMFSSTFSGCSGLTGAIPDGLFAGISGAPAYGMFSSTFNGCSGLTSIPENLFGNISGTARPNMFYQTFYNCTSLTGPSARINGQYLYEIWPSATSFQVNAMYYNATGLSDYRCIPTVWGGGGEDCSAPTAEFTLTTTSTNSFSFKISAAGEFVVDWGDGTVETITKPDTTNTTYSHNYTTAGEYTIGLSGQATAYNTGATTAAISFYVNYSDTQAKKIASIDGSLGAIFGTLSSDTNNQPKFYGTFSGASNMTGSIPSDLFAGISGAPASYMFAYTFDGYSGLTSIPAGLFAGISGAPAEYMFSSTFSNCSGLTSIPSDLFAGISGAPASNMFDNTFSGCSGLTSIPDDLFAGISGAPASNMFSETFAYCSGLTSIPDGLFAGISGAPAGSMFNGTFEGCTGLTGAILDGLFGNLTGAPAESMFAYTFSGCSGLTGAIPDGLFGNLTGAPASFMFASTFEDCSGLTSIPDGLFGNLTGAPAEGMFGYTFSDCSGLTSIPENLFSNISGPAQDYMFDSTFYNCTSLTGPSARINGQYLYEIWPDATSTQVGDMYYNATGLSDYRCIPTVWGGGGEDCSAPTAEFTLTTTSTNSFSFKISAAGEFVVDWGDGTVETISKPDTTNTTYSHNYTTAGEYTIGLGGQATAYNTDESTAAISFYVNSSQTKIASIDGSLGAIFGTLSSDTNNQPRFYQTFFNATNMKGSIPSDLFSGISGAPASSMFSYTFSGCSGLTGAIPAGLFGNLYGAPASNMFSYTFNGCSGLTSIPSDLFAGISGAPASYMFYGTFSDCSGLTSIPSDLFAGISGAPASDMFGNTFNGCSGLTGAIPADLFAGISGAPANGMFVRTFEGCSGLTSIPENLFGNISGTAQDYMFRQTFYNCTSLTGPSARINGQYLYEIWPSATSSQVSDMYYNATGLSDYSSIPTLWK